MPALVLGGTCFVPESVPIMATELDAAAAGALEAIGPDAQALSARALAMRLRFKRVRYEVMWCFLGVVSLD